MLAPTIELFLILYDWLRISSDGNMLS